MQAVWPPVVDDVTKLDQRSWWARRSRSTGDNAAPVLATQTHSPASLLAFGDDICAEILWSGGGTMFPTWAISVSQMSQLPTDPQDHDNQTSDSQLEDAAEALADARERLAQVPAHVVVVNHIMGLYELAAIHLSAEPPRLAEAALAIDAVACLVEGLGSRLGDEHATLADALGNIRLAFVQIKGAIAPE